MTLDMLCLEKVNNQCLIHLHYLHLILSSKYGIQYFFTTKSFLFQGKYRCRSAALIARKWWDTQGLCLAELILVMRFLSHPLQFAYLNFRVFVLCCWQVSSQHYLDVKMDLELWCKLSTAKFLYYFLEIKLNYLVLPELPFFLPRPLDSIPKLTTMLRRQLLCLVDFTSFSFLKECLKCC